MSNPYEMELEEDEETGEVVLPPGYTGRRAAPYGMSDASSRNIGETSQRISSGTTPAASTPNPDPISYQTSPNCPDCPPCPRCPTHSRMRSSPDSLIGLVIGLGLVGGVLWYSGKMLSSVGEYEEDVIDGLPSSVPKLAASISEGAGDTEEE